MDDPRPDVWCFVAMGYYHPIKMVTLEYAEHYKNDCWIVVGPDPQQLAERMAWRERNKYAPVGNDGA